MSIFTDLDDARGDWFSDATDSFAQNDPKWKLGVKSGQRQSDWYSGPGGESATKIGLAALLAIAGGSVFGGMFGGGAEGGGMFGGSGGGEAAGGSGGGGSGGWATQLLQKMGGQGGGGGDDGSTGPGKRRRGILDTGISSPLFTSSDDLIDPTIARLFLEQGRGA